MIRHEGKNRWVLYTADGKRVLGEHDSKEEAQAQENEIYAKRARRSARKAAAAVIAIAAEMVKRICRPRRGKKK